MPTPPRRPTLQAAHHTPRRPIVKVCGITREADIRACLAYAAQREHSHYTLAVQ